MIIKTTTGIISANTDKKLPRTSPVIPPTLNSCKTVEPPSNASVIVVSQPKLVHKAKENVP